ncbi:hypothetical protein Tco_0486173, partial [Tanacetum coccineum]
SVEDAASSSTPTLTADEASPLSKQWAKNPTVKTPSKPNGQRILSTEPEDSDVNEVCAAEDNMKKRKRSVPNQHFNMSLYVSIY